MNKDLRPELERVAAGQLRVLGVHESQSRLWEKIMSDAVAPVLGQHFRSADAAKRSARKCAT